MTTALVDGDLIAYINAASAEGDSKEIAIIRADRMLNDILQSVGAESYRIFISGGKNFRYEINPNYKANRTQPDPIYRQDCIDFLVREHNAEVTDGYEADDALGCAQTDDTIICSLDKDLRMISGKHYTWPIVRGGKIVRDADLFEVKYLDGIRTFYRQMLIGDSSDNIMGVAGIGDVKAKKLIHDDMVLEEDMGLTVALLYKDEYGEDYNNVFNKNADCLWIWRDLGVTYTVREEMQSENT